MGTKNVLSVISNLLVLKIHHFAAEGLKITKRNDLWWSLEHARLIKSFRDWQMKLSHLASLNGSPRRITLDKTWTASQFRVKCLSCEAFISGFRSVIEGTRNTLELWKARYHMRTMVKRGKHISFLFVVARSFVIFKHLWKQIIRYNLRKINSLKLQFVRTGKRRTNYMLWLQARNVDVQNSLLSVTLEEWFTPLRELFVCKWC